MESDICLNDTCQSIRGNDDMNPYERLSEEFTEITIYSRRVQKIKTSLSF